jgi:hypothetical protein
LPYSFEGNFMSGSMKSMEGFTPIGRLRNGIPPEKFL